MLWFCFFPVQLMIDFGVGLIKVMVEISFILLLGFCIIGSFQL